MRITRRCTCTLISLSTMFSQNQLNPIMQRVKKYRSMQRALPVYDNATALHDLKVKVMDFYVTVLHSSF